MHDRRQYFRTLTCLFTVSIFAACGGGDAPGDAGEAPPTDEAPMASPVDESTAGNVAGMVMFEGTAPTPEAVDMSGEPTCADQYTEPPMTQEVVVGETGGLANVFVYVKEGLSGLEFPTPSGDVLLDQQGCRYHPHVFGVQVDQTLTIRNSDGILHNINATPTENRGFNISQPVNMDATRSFPIPEVMIPVRCDVHGWMEAYLGVMEHPYFWVTGEDGSFDLSTLPPGDYVLEAWHEEYGVQTQNVTVATGETAEVSFTFDESMAGAYVPLGEPLIIRHHTMVGGAP